MRRAGAAIVSSLLTFTPIPLAGGQDLPSQTGWDGYPHGRIVGSVEIPALHDAVNSGVHPPPLTSPVVTYIEPTEQTAIAAVVTAYDQLASLEHGYEEISAAVFDVRSAGNRRWYQVHYTTATGSGAAWLSDRDAGTYRALGEMLRSDLTFLTASWDGVFYDRPGGTAQAMRDADGDRENVRVVALAGDRFNLWVRIEVLDRSICDGRGEPSVIATGWTPAYGRDGRVSVWYPSRGC